MSTKGQIMKHRT